MYSSLNTLTVGELLSLIDDLRFNYEVSGIELYVENHQIKTQLKR